MSAYEGTIMKAFGQAVVPLPDDIAYALGEHVIISRSGDTMTIRPKISAEEALKHNQRFADQIRAIWAGAPAREINEREPVDAPERPGLI